MNSYYNRLQALNCPNCGATVDVWTNDLRQIQCRYCGSMITVTPEPQNLNVNIMEDFGSVTPAQIIQRVGRLFYLCKDDQAKQLLEKGLIYFPNDPMLLELESQCDCFLTRNIGNYLRMLAVRTFLTDGDCARYRTEIDGFCRMVGNNATNSLNTPPLRKQSSDNYQAILGYIAYMKQALANTAVQRDDALYASVRNAVLKLSAIVCNTIYVRSVGSKRQFIMLIDYNYRRFLQADFNTVSRIGENQYAIVDESVIKKYIPEA